MTKLRLTLAAMLLTSAAFLAVAQQVAVGNVTTTSNPDSTTAITSDASPTQRKATHSAAQRRKADMEEAAATRELNEQAAALAKPNQ